MTSALGAYSAAAARAATQLMACYSTSFGAATRLLGRRHRQHVRSIYALVRVGDELVDGVAAEAGLTPAEQHAALDRLVAETHRAVGCGYSADVVVHAFATTAREAGIGTDLIDPFFDSMRMDLTQDSGGDVATYDAASHAAYVHGSAEVVGLMCLRVFLREEALGAATTERLEHGARQLGRAFQNINFLRDLADDTERLQRSYLGTATLSAADRDAWVATVRAQLAEAEAVIPELPLDARAAVRSAALLFRALADRVAGTDVEELYRTRVRVPDPVKAALIGRALVRTAKELR